jgi:hypothetical protein
VSIRNHSVWDGKIDRRKHTTRVEKLQDILLSYAKTDENRELVRKNLQYMIDDHVPVTEIENSLVCAIADGVLYGNWPWWKEDLLSVKQKGQKVR